MVMPSNSLPGLVFQKTIRGVKKARKQAQRGAKFARYVAGRVRSAEKSLYFHLRDTRAGQVLLRAATFAGGGRELRERQRLAATHIRQTGEPLIDQAKGWGAVAFDPASPEFSGVLATSRRLFEVKKAKIACLLYTSPSPRDKRQSRMPSSA